MRLAINHLTEYHYDKPVPYGLQEVRLSPQTGPGQTVSDWDLAIDGAQSETAFSDQHGNYVNLLSIEPGEQIIRIRGTGFIETEDLNGIIGPHRGFAPLWYFSRPTRLTWPGPQITKLCASLPESEAGSVGQLHHLGAAVATAVRYQNGHTHTDSTAEDALEAGHGVCQDQTHVFISAARALGFPARYVSGYLLMTDRVHQSASHAWAEIHVNGLGWVGFDVANALSPDDRYVRIATGLDYHEAAPISGMRYGEGQESMSVALTVEQ